jgi:glycine/D-amino acid oxidase-like deaminating enzyme
MSTNLDYLIIGGGLAGSILGWTLQRQGASVIIVDNNPAMNASRTAAGLINPITGKRLVKTVNFEQLYSDALALYRTLEWEFATALYFDMPLIRLFRSPDGIEMFEKRCKDEGYRPYMGQLITAETPPFNAPLGGFEIHQAGYLDTTRLLDTLHHHFLQQEMLEYADFEYDDLTIGEDRVGWRGYRAHKVIFCEGYRMAANPWFGDLPLQGAKGEILSVEVDGLQLRQMINGGHWLIPREDGSYRLGATHSWHALDEEISKKEHDALLAGFHEVISGDYAPRVTAQRAGVRPATRDRQPFVGLHQQHACLSIFNGFGAKGSLLIPWHAKQFATFLSGEGELPAASDIKRFA